jgi:hypothetical protein
MEFVEDNRESLYTLEELKAAYASAREEWNGKAHPKDKRGRSRIEMYLSSENAEAREIDELDMMEMFWEMTEKPSTFTSAGITITVGGKKYTYEPLGADGMPDMEFRRLHTGRQFYVQYDPCDMLRVRLFMRDATGTRYVATADPYIEVHRAIQEQADGERSFLVRQNMINQGERVRRQVEAAELEMAHGVAPEQHGLRRPRLRGISLGLEEALMGGKFAVNGEQRTGYATIGRERGTEDYIYETVGVGEYEKEMSMATYDMVDMYDKL